MEKAGIPWSVPVAMEDIPDTGMHMAIEASAETREAVAKLAALRDLSRLAAEFDLTRQGAGVHVSGRVMAKVGQTCVVTLEPVDNDIDETVELVFVPGSAPGADEMQFQAAADESETETLLDGRIDLGALATEFLVLGIDPYPRKAGAEFATPTVEDAGERPFAALEALKKRLGGGPS